MWYVTVMYISISKHNSANEKSLEKLLDKYPIIFLEYYEVCDTKEIVNIIIN